MAISFDKALGIHEHALKLRTQRAEVLANNLANADTPNFKARDIDFKAALSAQGQGSERMAMSSTNNRHHSSTPDLFDQGLLRYRTPQQPSIDGNTVEEHVEHGEYMKNSLAFQAGFTFLNGRFKGLMTAIKGD